MHDPEVASALQLMHNHAAEQIGMEDIVEHLQVSRRALELKFKSSIGRTPYDELQRVRLVRVQRLLLETDFRFRESLSYRATAAAPTWPKSFRNCCKRRRCSFAASIDTDRVIRPGGSQLAVSRYNVRS